MTSNTARHWQLSIIERRTLLVLGDFVFGLVSLAVSLAVWASDTGEWLGFSLAFFQERVAAWFYLLPIAWLFLMVEMYDVHRAASFRKTAQGVASAAALGLVLYLFVYFASESKLPRIGVAAFLVSASSLTLIWRFVYTRVFTSARFLRRTLLVGAGRAGQLLLDALEGLQSRPFEIVGLIDDDPAKLGHRIHDFQVIASSADLLEIVEAGCVSDIIVAISGEIKSSTFQALLDAQHQGVGIMRMPVVYEEMLGRVPIQVLEADWILRSFVDEFRINRFYKIAKRLMDILGGLVGVLFVGLLLPFVGTAILLESGWPIFYRQVRLGQGGEPFEIIKFRTMRQDAEVDGNPVLAREDDDRATRVGRLLRKTHLDEAPQFLNVLLGTMSLVGPRSERPKFVAEYLETIPFYRARFLVKPGVTGWAQVNFGYAGNLQQTMVKLEYDLYYIKHRNIILDILTLLRTPGTVLGMRGQ